MSTSKRRFYSRQQAAVVYLSNSLEHVNLNMRNNWLLMKFLLTVIVECNAFLMDQKTRQKLIDSYVTWVVNWGAYIEQIFSFYEEYIALALFLGVCKRVNLPYIIQNNYI